MSAYLDHASAWPLSTAVLDEMHRWTAHLGSRFELANFHDRTLLIGSDVPPDFLSCEESQQLKALTGGDRLSVEFKGKSGAKAVVGDWNVIVTANSRLKVNVQGDLGAWSRRLLLLEFLLQGGGEAPCKSRAPKQC